MIMGIHDIPGDPVDRSYRYAKGTRYMGSVDRCHALIKDVRPGVCLLYEMCCNPPVRRQGHGGRLMCEILRYADERNVTLIANVTPYVSTVDHDELTGFYKRFGWKSYSKYMMTRDADPSKPDCYCGYHAY
jgi:GNAT superfamily N-acetyltransferase